MPEKKQSIFQPQLTDISTPTYVQQGVVDTSTAQAITAVGKTALAARKGYQEAGLEKDIQGEISSFFTGVEAEQRIPGQAENVSLLAEQTAGFLSPEEDESLQSAQKDLAKLGRMRAKGAGSTSELRARVAVITKQYINSMPGLATDFRKLAASEIGDYKAQLNLYDEQQKALAKEGKTQEAVWKAASIDAVKDGIDVIGRDRTDWYPEYLDNQDKKRTTTEFKQIREVGIIKKERLLESDQWTANHQGTALTYRAEASAIADRTDIGVVEQQELLRALTSKHLLDISGWNPSGTTTHPKVVALTKDIEASAVVYSDVISGKIKREAVGNKVAILQDTAASLLLENPSYAILAQGAKHFQNTLAGLELNKKARKYVMEVQNRVASGDLPFPTPNKRKPEAQEGIPSYFKHLSAWTKQFNEDPEANPQEAAVIVDNISTVLDGWHKNETTPAFDGLLDMASEPWFGGFLEKYTDADLKERLSVPIRDFITTNVNTAFSGKLDPTRMRIINTPNGEMYVEALAKDAQTVQEVANLNRNYVSRLNKFVKAEANIQGTTQYAEGSTRLADVLNKQAKALQVVSEKGNNVSNYKDEKDVTNLIQIIDNGPTGGLYGDPETNKSVYIATPLDLLYGKDVEDFTVLATHINKIMLSVKDTVPEIIDQILLQLPHNKPWAIKVREDARLIKAGKQPQGEVK